MNKLSFVLLAIIGFALVSCSSDSVAPEYKPISFADSKPLVFNVSAINVVNEYQSPGIAPNVEHLFITTPAQALQVWGKERLQAKGTSKSLRIVIKDASVIEQAIPKSEGWKGTFTKEQTSNFTARLNARLEIVGDDPIFPEAEINVTVSRSKTLGEDATLNDRNALYYELTNELINDFNKEAEKNIQTSFYKYLVQ